MQKILGIGNALVDVMTILDSDDALKAYNLPKGSMQLVDEAKSRQLQEATAELRRDIASGGSAANTIHGLAMLGANVSFIGSIGRDSFGDLFEKDLRKAGAETILYRRNSPTGTALTFISRDSERTFATHLGAAIELGPADLSRSDFKGCDILYLEGYLIVNRQLIEKACILAKQENMKIVIDLASYNVVEANLEAFRDIVIRYADIVFANEDEARVYTGHDPEKAISILADHCDVAVIKMGARGSLIKRGYELIRIGADSVNVKDTTGAGDLYASGFLYGYSRGMNLELCGQIGSLLGGKVIGVLGAKLDPGSWDGIKIQVADMEL